MQWRDIPDFPKAASELLDKYFTKFTTKVINCQTSADRETTKLLLELQDGMQVEAVVMHYDTTGEHVYQAMQHACMHGVCKPFSAHLPCMPTTAMRWHVGSGFGLVTPMA